MKQKYRYRRKRKGDGLIVDWPPGRIEPDELAKCVQYVGSAEHKSRPVHGSYDMAPALRSDASKCDPIIPRELAERALRMGIARMCVSEQFEGSYPRYVYARLSARPYIARLINREQGLYKGWPIEEFELPTDPYDRLSAEEWHDV